MNETKSDRPTTKLFSSQLDPERSPDDFNKLRFVMKNSTEDESGAHAALSSRHYHENPIKINI